MKTFVSVVAVSVAAVLAAAVWWRRNPSACPYGQRAWIEVPHPLITRARLKEALQPAPGHRVLEVGSGTGYYTLEAARWVGSEGRVEMFDLQQEMLDHALARAAGQGIGNIGATRGDARDLPYPDGSFDRAFLVLTLGEIPDQQTAVSELARVLKPGGILVVGELMGDPHWVSPKTIRRLAAIAGLNYERRIGSVPGSFSVLTRP
jgi:ubiquinone/menaquinone biosynthesis C-methylase UbiE